MRLRGGALTGGWIVSQSASKGYHCDFGEAYYDTPVVGLDIVLWITLEGGIHCVSGEI